MMESRGRGGDSPEKEPATERSEDHHFSKRVLGSDLGGVKLGTREIVDESCEIQCRQSNKELLKRRASAVGVKEKIRVLGSDLGGVKLGTREIVDESCEGVPSIVDESYKELLKRRAFDVGVKEKTTEAKQKVLIFLDETIKEKRTHAERKEKAKTKEMEQKSKFPELKRREFRNRSISAESSKVKEKGSDSLIRKRSRRIFEAKEKAKTKEMEQKSKFPELKRREFRNRSIRTEKDPEPEHSHDDEDIDEVFVIDDEEDPKPLLCADSEFNDFNKSVTAFAVGQVWAMYDPVDAMPRLYAQIKEITNSQSLFQVTRMEPKDDETIPIACGRYIHGNTETTESILTFSHLMHPVRHERNFVHVLPKIGETWALFRNWSKSWDTNPEQHKPPYEYDFVEVILISDEDGIGVTYLDKVEGFVSLFSESVLQREVISFLIKPDELHRISHKVPSFRMTGKEREGVPPGSFELDPAAIPIIKVNEHDESSKDIPIIKIECESL